MQNFDWQTDEDETLWAPEIQPEPEPLSNHRRWLFLLLTVAVLLAAGAAIGREVNQRLDETQAATEEDVLAADHLARTAAAEGDGEVLITLLSGRDPHWTQTQGELLDAQLLFGRAATPFGLVEQPEEYGPLAVELSNDLNAAVVSGAQTYAVPSIGGSETITLTQTWVYRRGQRNWLLSPPDDEFWGGWATTTGEKSTVVFPKRDEEFAVSFAADLDNALDSFCIQSGLDCPADLHMHVRLETDPEALLDLSDPVEMLATGTRLELPTASLVGLPGSDAAYDALVRGYTAQVLSAAVGEITGWECCAQVLYYQALVNQMLAELSYRGRPLAPEEYLDLVHIGLGDLVFEELWDGEQLDESSAQDQIFVAGLVDFLIDRGREPAEMLDGLSAYPAFTDWLVGRSQPSRIQLTNAWNEYVRAKVLAHQETETPPLDFPAGDLLLFCSPAIGEDAIMRYDPQQAALENLIPINGEFAIGSGIPGTNGLLVTAGAEFDNEVITTYWPSASNPIPVEPVQPDDILLYIGQPIDPLNTQVPIWVFNDNNPEGVSFAILELDECTAETSCAVVPVQGQPVWSPAGTKIVLEEVDSMMLVGDRSLESWTSLGPGRSPVWLNEQTVAYLNIPGRLIRLNNMDQEGPVTLLEAETLDDLLPQNRQRFSLQLQKLLFHPDRPDTLLVLATTGLSAEMFMFALKPAQPGMDWYTAVENDALEVRLLFDNRTLTYSEPDSIFSADGRWLTMRTPGGEILLYDQDTQQTTSLARASDFIFLQYAWSPTEPWLAYVGDNHVELIRPEADGSLYRHFYFLDDQSCASASWTTP